MKKILSIVLILTILISLCSCGEVSYDNSSETQTIQCKHTICKTVVERTDYTEGYTLNECTICGYTYKTDEIESFYAAAKDGELTVIKTIKSNLTDPDSMIYDGTCIKTNNASGELDEGRFIYRVHYNAKNSFGGFIGYKYVFYEWTDDYRSVSAVSAEYYTERFNCIFYKF